MNVKELIKVFLRVLAALFLTIFTLPLFFIIFFSALQRLVPSLSYNSPVLVFYGLFLVLLISLLVIWYIYVQTKITTRNKALVLFIVILLVIPFLLLLVMRFGMFSSYTPFQPTPAYY